jgi:hypothetical protein
MEDVSRATTTEGSGLAWLRELQRRGSYTLRDVSAWYLVRLPAAAHLRSAPLGVSTEVLPTKRSHAVTLPPMVVRPLAVRGAGPFPEHIRLGRGSDCDVRLELSFVSKHHATLGWNDGRLFVIDAGSVNGTAVDGVRLAPGERAQLRPSGTLHVGPLELVLVTADQLDRMMRS